MTKTTLNLVVLRSPDIARAAAFYTRLGLLFTKHRHGTVAEHFAAELPGGVFELYGDCRLGGSAWSDRIATQGLRMRPPCRGCRSRRASC